MKENIYDKEAFFEKYKVFPRSVEGLSAAGEWHALQKMLPPFGGKRVLDLGCGFGWHCMYAAENGAASVVGVDISKKMLNEAQRKNQYVNITYICSAIEDYAYPKEAFDVVISSLAFHYCPSFADICAKVRTCLVPGGDFVFSVEHPIFTAQGKQDWAYDAAGNPLHWPVDNYFYEGARNATFLNEQVTKYHKTINTYLKGLLENGFVVTDFCEPQPSSVHLETIPEMKQELRRPMMLLVAAKKV